jgi:hypothetical protein
LPDSSRRKGGREPEKTAGESIIIDQDELLLSDIPTAEIHSALTTGKVTHGKENLPIDR